MKKVLPKKKDRIEKLRELIEYHRLKYHTDDAPVITDEAYDALVRELVLLEKETNDEHHPMSPTQKVGGTVLDKFVKVRHEIAQWSYDNIFDYEELCGWVEKIKRFIEKTQYKGKSPTYFVELKIDGMKIICTYKSGKLVLASTRGDGETGEDITHNARAMKSIPQDLGTDIDLIVVGEAWMKKSDLKKTNETRAKQNLPLFANTRNATAGSLRQLDSEITRSRNIQTFFYAIDKFVSKTETEPLTQSETLQTLKKFGFSISSSYKLCKSIDDIETYYRSESAIRNKHEFGVDGLVIKINELPLSRALGYTSKSPRGGVAYKFPAEEVTTIVEDIQIQVGRTGALTPVAHLRPVRVAGSTVSRATLHNEDEINRLGLMIGDTVILKKAGDVIPEIVKVLPELRTGSEKRFTMPTKCPICGSKVEKETIGTKEASAALYCTNKNCFAQDLERMIHFVSKKGMNIVGMGDRIVEKLMNEGLISEYSDIYELKTGDLSVLEKFGEKSADNLINSIEQSKNTTLARVLYALGIRHVGEETADLLARELKTIEKLLNASLETLENIEGVGPVVAIEIVKWFADKNNQLMLSKLLKHLVIKESKAETVSSKLQNKIFVLTGTLTALSRDDAKARIKSLGGKVASSVSSNTDYLIAGENPGSKFNDAQKLGIKTIDEKEFLKMIA